MPKFDWSNLGPFVQAVKTACGAGAMSMGKEVQNDVRQHFGSGRYTPSAPGSPPNMQRNGLRNSIKVQASGQLTAIVGSNIPYGWTHETGNGGRPINAKTTKYLPVPLNASAKAMMEDKGTQSLKTRGDFTVFRSRAGNLIMIAEKKHAAKAYVKGADGKPKYRTVENAKPRFVLKKSIRVKKRPFMAPALARARGNPALTAVFAVGTTKALRKAGFPVKVVAA